MKKILANNIGKIVGLISCLIIALSIVSCYGSSETTSENGEGLYFTLNEDGESYSVSGVYDDFNTPDYLKIIIPEEYDGKPVTRIESLGTENLLYGFIDDGNIDLECLEIPRTIEYIDHSAINACSMLESIEVDENNSFFKDIDGVLYTKDETTLIFYPKVRTDTSYEIPNNVNIIAEYAFFGCSSLVDISIGDNVTKIGIGAFYDTGYYNDSTNWENDVLYLNDYLLDVRNTASGEYVIKEGTTVIASGAFEYCGKITSIVIPDTITIIDDDTFSDCSSLTNIVIPNSIKSIGANAFSYCTSLESVVIPDSVENIGESAFSVCTALVSITVGNGVKTIGSGAFQICRSLEAVYYTGSEEEWENIVIDYSYNEELYDATIYYNYVAVD